MPSASKVETAARDAAFEGYLEIALAKQGKNEGSER